MYGTIGVTDAWSVCAFADNPMNTCALRFGLASSHRLADHWIAGAALSATFRPDDWTEILVNAGARAVLGRSFSYRFLLSSFPVSLAAIHSP